MSSIPVFGTHIDIDDFSNMNERPGNENFDPIPHEKSAYYFGFWGNGPSSFDGQSNGIVERFIEDNNGWVHFGAWNDVDKDKFDIGGERHKFCGAIFACPIFQPSCDNDHCGWERIKRQMRDILERLQTSDINGKNTKLILSGYSFGGMAATVVATDSFYNTRGIEFDLVWLLDPVGPGGSPARLGVERVCPIDDPITGFCNDLNPNFRVFLPNTKAVIARYQTLAPPPFDFGDVLSWFNPNDVATDTQRNGFYTLDGINKILFVNGEECRAFLCHIDIGDFAPGNINVLNYFKFLNNKPTFGTLFPSPSPITLDEGTSGTIDVTAVDKSAREESLSEMDLKFTAFNDAPEISVDETQGDKFTDGAFKGRTGSVDIDAFDDLEQDILIQVEDNGFPCGNCITDANAMGAKGHWARTTKCCTNSSTNRRFRN